MCEVNNMDNDLLDLLAQELGEIHRWEEECPGVYYLSILPTIEEGGEYYAILEGAPITQEARAIGRKLGDTSILIYRLGAEDGAWEAVEYEILRYKAIHGIPMPEGKSLPHYTGRNCVRTISARTPCPF